MADLSNTITNAANEAKSISIDGLAVSAHPLADLIEADKYLTAKNAADKNHFGMRFIRLKPPGAGE